MKLLVKKWGNSAAVRIPASVLAASRLAVDQEVEVREEDGRIVIEAVRGDALSALLQGISDDNLHGEVSFGAPVGREVL